MKKSILDLKVSIVIVCMNNLKNLYPCLNSIKECTSLSYEIFVIAYLFSKENLKKLRKDFPWVTIIESNEIRGFSENNNLALRQARGKYCFVLNDDTEMKMPVIDLLVKSIETMPSNVAIISPKLIYPNGETQFCGRPPHDWKTYLLQNMGLWNEKEDKVYSNKNGIFKTYNIIGACFLIKREIFESVGWFDERYFFCPEDIALSTELNKKGYECWVNADGEIIHYEGMSGKSVSKIQSATKPSALKGSIIFFSHNNIVLQFLLRIIMMQIFFMKYLYHKLKFYKNRNTTYENLSQGERNAMIECFSSRTPKQIFIKYYSKI